MSGNGYTDDRFKDSVTTTGALDQILKKGKPEDFGVYVEENAESLMNGGKAFSAYMREKFREKGLKQQDIFIAADMPERYAYKLISEEKHTVQRDYILRICLAAEFTLHEAQTALKLYGMSPLYSRIPRDAALIIAFNNGMYDTHDVDAFLVKNGLPGLKTCGDSD